MQSKRALAQPKGVAVRVGMDALVTERVSVWGVDVMVDVIVIEGVLLKCVLDDVAVIVAVMDDVAVIVAVIDDVAVIVAVIDDVAVIVAVIDDVAVIVCDALVVEVAEVPKLDEAVEEAVTVTLLVAVEHDNSSQGPSNSSATKPGPSGMPTPSRQNGEAGFRGCDDESAEMLTIVPGKRPGAHDVPPRPDSPELMPRDCQPPPLPAVYVRG